MTASLAKVSESGIARASRGWWLVGALVAVVYLVSARWHVLYGEQNTDEGFYAVTTRAVAQGLMPYRDFGFTQPPLVLYANSLPLRAIGFGLFSQRIVNGFWAALALALAGAWLMHRTNAACGWGLVLLFSLSAPWMYFVHLGKTYGLTTLLVILATGVFLELRAGPRRNFLLGLLVAAGTATRLPAIPFFAALWLLALWPRRHPTGREALAALGGIALGAAVCILPFWLAAPEATRFWTIDFHRLSVPNKPWHLAWVEPVALAPAVWFLAIVALVIAAWRRRLLTREAGVALAGLVALAANLLPEGVYEEYGVPFLLPVATAGWAIAYSELRTLKLTGALSFAVALIAVHVGTTPALTFNTLPQRRGHLSQWLPPRTPDYNFSLRTQLTEARKIVEASLAPEAPFIGSNVILAAETGRRVPPELLMGPFSFTAEMTSEQAARLHLATRAQLGAWFSQPDVTLLSFFVRWDLNYEWSMPSFAERSGDARDHAIAALQRDFALVYHDGGYFLLVRRDFRGLQK